MAGGKHQENRKDYWQDISHLLPSSPEGLSEFFEKEDQEEEDNPEGEEADAQNRWFKKKQRERNRIEDSIGNGKEHYGLDRVRYSIKNGSEIWVRAGILAMNLKAATNRA